jgi:hypothetical protein
MMNTLLDEYLRRGYSDIVLLEGDHSERGDWYGTETSTQTVVAKRGAEFVRVSGVEKHTFGPKGKHNADIVREQQITREEYETLSDGNPFLDSAAIRSSFEEKTVGFEQARSVKKELESDAPNCPVHNKPMKLARGPKAYFFGCSRYPKCLEKRWLTPTQKAQAEGLLTLRTCSIDREP